MRARRLRRLGVAAPTITAAPSDNNALADTQIDIKSAVRKDDNDEKDENQHKQKQQKFDESIKDSVLNNNETELGKLPCNANLNFLKLIAYSFFLVNCPRESTSNLTHCSRLLTEFEKQRIENNLNQNENVTTNQMETDEGHVLEKGCDGDSGIENMETDEMPATTAPFDVQRTVSESEELNETIRIKEIEICISRILDAFWTDHCKGQIIVPETASCYREFVDDHGSVDFENLAFQIIIEVIMQYFEGKRVDYKGTWESYSSTPIRSSTASQMDAGVSAGSSNQMELDNNCPGPMLAPHNLPNHGACSYLIQAYNRCWNEHDRYNGPKYIKKFGNSVLAIIYSLKEQLVRTVILILNGTLFHRPTPSSKVHRSVLLDLLYEDAVRPDFLRHLTEEAYKYPKNMSQIFGTLMNNLFTDMQAKVVGRKIDITPINIMSQLLNISINGNPDGIVRPMCNIVSKIYNFYPALCTETPGREIAKVSYLGPFLSVSVFSEENAKLFEDEDDDLKANLGVGLQSVSKAQMHL